MGITRRLEAGHCRRSETLDEGGGEVLARARVVTRRERLVGMGNGGDGEDAPAYTSRVASSPNSPREKR